MKTIGVIGTAKNTGKTTTLSFILKGFQLRGFNLAVTGIGYDGEEIDNITQLPKPRLFFERNTILATSEKCLINTDAKFDTILETPLVTALGKIVLVKITEPGMIVVAGPNSVNGLREILNLIKQETISDVLLVDGSLNRISPMYILDKLIFTTGASRNTNIQKLADEIKVIEKVFLYNKSVNYPNLNRDESLKIIYKDVSLNLYNNTLVDEDDFLLLESSVNQNVEKILIPGLISVDFLIKHLPGIAQRIKKPFELIFTSPFQLLLTDQFSKISTLLKIFNIKKLNISYRYKPELSAVTINPFYPKLNNYKYIPSYLDKEKFYSDMKSSSGLPMFNVMDSEADGIFELI